jgi:hypothetical protein
MPFLVSMPDFTFTHANGENKSTQRLWIGQLIDPEDCIGIIVSDQRPGKPINAVDFALPVDQIPSLIEYLNQFVDADKF